VPSVLPFLAPRILHSAFLRVRENHGCAGADGINLTVFESALPAHLAALRQAVEAESYFAWPLRRIQAEKHPGSAERRTLLVPAVTDRVLQTAVARYLEPYIEPEFEECSFAYRRGRSVRMAVERVYHLHQQGYTWLVDADIDDFFDSVDREHVLGRLSTLLPAGAEAQTALRLTRLWLDYAVWDGLHLVRPPLGLPQGAVISPMLANLCLDVLDDRLLAEGFKLVRYADDFVILTKSRRAAEQACSLAAETLTSLRLRLDQGKTRVTRFTEGFKFLGAIFLKDLLMRPWTLGRKRLRVLSVAPALPVRFFPLRERRTLRHYRA